MAVWCNQPAIHAQTQLNPFVKNSFLAPNECFLQAIYDIYIYYKKSFLAPNECFLQAIYDIYIYYTE